MATIIHVADEVLLMIFKNFSFKDLLTGRFVCKRLARIGEDLAFKRIIYTQDEQGVNRFLELSRSTLYVNV